jgi:uncharacterized membrane protein
MDASSIPASRSSFREKEAEAEEEEEEHHLQQVQEPGTVLATVMVELLLLLLFIIIIIVVINNSNIFRVSFLRCTPLVDPWSAHTTFSPPRNLPANEMLWHGTSAA